MFRRLIMPLFLLVMTVATVVPAAEITFVAVPVLVSISYRSQGPVLSEAQAKV